MKKVVLYGNYFINRKVKKLIMSSKLRNYLDVIYFCDINEGLHDLKLNKNELINIDEVFNRYINNDIDFVIITDDARELKKNANFLNQKKIMDIYHISNTLLSKNIDEISLNDIIKLDFREESLNVIEIDITEHCNLNCKGCARCCDIYKLKKYANLSTFINDIERTKELFGNINLISIMGGEPLLNKELPDFIYYTRKTFPNAAIDIITNGLLINQLDSKSLSIIKDNEAQFYISNYKPTQQKRPQIEEFLKKNNMYYKFTPLLTQFRKKLTTRPNNDKFQSHCNCIDKFLHLVKDGSIYKCPFIAYIQKINDYYNTNIRYYDGKYSLYNNWNTNQLYNILSNPIESCKYCSENLEYFDWELATPKFEYSHFIL